MFGLGTKPNDPGSDDAFVIEYNAFDPDSASKEPIMFTPRPKQKEPAKPEKTAETKEPGKKPAPAAETIKPAIEAPAPVTPPKPTPAAPSAPLPSFLEEVLSKHESPFASKSEDKPKETPAKPQKIPITPPEQKPLYTAPTKGLLTDNQNKLASSSFANHPLLEKSQPTSYNKVLLITALLIMLLTVGAGAYYYLYVLNPSPTPETTDLPATGENNDPAGSNNDPAQPGGQTKTLADARPITLQSEETALIALKNQVEAVKTSPDTLSQEFFILKDAQAQTLNSQKVIADMNLQLQSIAAELSNVWAYLQLDASNTVKLGLLFEITNPVGIQEKIKTMEPTLPASLSSMYIDEQVVVPQQVTFHDSEFDARVRYHNISPTASIDWAIVESENRSLLIIATSKDTMQSILTKL